MTSPIADDAQPPSEAVPPEDVIYESRAARRKAALQALPWKALIVLMALVAALATLVVTVMADRPEAETREPTLESQAATACEGFVSQRLKAPATVSFVNTTAVASVSGYRVVGEVDAQNSFGALIRTAYTCEVTRRNGNWSLVSVTFAT
ncbi:hypothetical protein Afil01_40530 [Actinorhabdospora filicis]|uniref:Uncharacterized protein n=1 Tax=Actinorhabdospora filicis TaxID=1785913 RepID=A0A9W6SNL2_9ACTN|nr:hypothetical protein [Actinorhabdospora filicis]GLZ79246.1 hypothetical protein Afil01_40530 [Actinorhabdospora filicis]